MQECVLFRISTETIGSDVYCKIPFKKPSEACIKAALISSAVAKEFRVQVKSVSEPFNTGTLIPAPPNLPSSWGN
ncbi:hypothetical protein P6O83_15855, partial [Clostridium perfringens]|nr:hypothetical protein [Clostridium perfringens]